MRVGFRAGKFVGGLFASSLKAELEVIETGGDEFVEAFFVERKAGSDEVDVEICGAGGLDQLDEIGTGERFSAGEIQLHDTGLRGFGENAGPGLGRKFFGAGGEFARVGAVDAVEGAAVGKFGDEGEWGRESHTFSVISGKSKRGKSAEG